MATVLVIEDEPILARNICDAMTYAGHEAAHSGTGEEGLKLVADTRPDLVLLDYRLPGIDGLEVLRELNDLSQAIAVVMMTAHGNIDTAVEAMKLGASDFLTKPLDLQELKLVVERALRHRAVTEKLEYFRGRERADSALDRIIGESEPMLSVKAFVQRIAGTSALANEAPPSLLITGETGTGKDLVARAIHYVGPRHDAQFVHVNCTAMPDHLIESELFGHVKGAFTDARTDKRGLFELADGGTLFLDEIGHMKPALQAKLLSVLEQRTFRPVGGTRQRKVNVHVIAATNRPLQEATKAGEFREDLYHRLRVLTIHMPPLRERGDDVETLTNHFVAACAARFGVRIRGLSDAAMKLVREYDWPGNVRELLHTVESASLVTDGSVIGPEHLNIKPAPRAQVALHIPNVEQAIVLDFGADSPKLEDIEHQIIVAALKHCRHNVSKAARVLGISRDAVRYRLEKYGGGPDKAS